MLGSVGEEGGATTSGVELRMANESDVSRGELGITHCKRDVFLNMWSLEISKQILSMGCQTYDIVAIDNNNIVKGVAGEGGGEVRSSHAHSIKAGCYRIERVGWQIDNPEGRLRNREVANLSTRLTRVGLTASKRLDSQKVIGRVQRRSSSIQCMRGGRRGCRDGDPFLHASNRITYRIGFANLDANGGRGWGVHVGNESLKLLLWVVISFQIFSLSELAPYGSHLRQKLQNLTAYGNTMNSKRR